VAIFIRLDDNAWPEEPHMPATSAGILMFRRTRGKLELLLVHPGGPYWARKDDGAWSIPKGIYDEDEDSLAAARREFEEETGSVPQGEFIALGRFKQPSGKTVDAWAVESDFDVSGLKSNVFSIEWPPRSGRRQDFPEADRAAWFEPADATRKMTKGQRPMVGALLRTLGLAQ
jgi:predicted NUDIX family NTP pyrophosphohydrolase